ncbi:MAG: hypothetical protein KDC34_00940 [Saprospiraceae bacterium]|nr:hypothetical protein [Saprospiraceae bacterium]
MDQVTTISFFRFNSLSAKFWAFKMMRDSPGQLEKVAGLSFFKLMGSGRDKGFNPLPDWGVYCLLQVWDTENDAIAFFKEAPLIQQYRTKAQEVWTIYMRNIISKGLWSGQTPFHESENLDPDIPQLAVITRATIKLSHLIRFWRQVPASQRALSGNEGLLYTKGVGEVPIIQMATFSLWRNEDALKLFAYESRAHQKAIRMTRETGWYKEELFSRFQPYRMEGQWEGKSFGTGHW